MKAEKIEIKFAELHTGIFLAGKNLGVKIDPGRTPGVALHYEQQSRMLHVVWNNETALIPADSNVAYMVAGAPKKPLEQVSHPQIAPPSHAQVSTPFGHVFEGLGKGQTGIAKGKVVL